jgi:glutaminyl-tRNA synthetase
LYDRLFTVEQPDAEKETDFMQYINSESVQIAQAFAEPALKGVAVEEPLQFQRIGYFTKDQDSTEENLVFNRTVTLKDSYKPE